MLEGGKHVPDAIGVHSADLVGAGGDVERVDDLEVGVALDVDGELAALAPDEGDGGILNFRDSGFQDFRVTDFLGF